jgi:RNA polymerase-associated protein RTF1
VDARKKSNPLAQGKRVIVEITQLISSRDLALRRNDHAGADDLNRQIISLGGDPATGERIQRINENNRRKTKEAMTAAHAAAVQRKKAEEAIVRARQ